MNLETRARAAASSLHSATTSDAEAGLQQLHRTRRRRTVAKAAAVVVTVTAAIGLGLGQLQGEDEAKLPVSRPDSWVLVTGSGIGGADNPAQPRGDEWAEPLAEQGIQSYPAFRSVDPATGRFLVQNYEATRWMVMKPGRRQPLATISADFGAILGPGPDEVTVISADLSSVVVLGPGGEVRRTVGAASGQLFGWSPDGETWAEVRTDHGRVAVLLRRPGVPGLTTVYDVSEEAPPWYDPEEHRFGDRPGEFNDWGSPRVVDLRWAPDSQRVAFITMATADGSDTERRVQWSLFLADAGGEAERLDVLATCSEPVDEDGQYARDCNGEPVSLAWAPDGKSLTVLADARLTRYGPTGGVLESEPTSIKGPVVWLE